MTEEKANYPWVPKERLANKIKRHMRENWVTIAFGISVLIVGIKLAITYMYPVFMLKYILGI